MTSAVKTPVITPPGSYPTPTEPGYIMTLKLGDGDYEVFAYTVESNGTKNYLPSSCDLQIIEKIQGLTRGLLNAHEARRASLNEPQFEINSIDASGLKISSNNIISHDFLIQPLSSTIADQMASSISLKGTAMQAAAVKAQDVWNALDKTFRQGIGGSPNPTQLSTTPSSASPSVSSTPSAQPTPPQAPDAPASPVQTPLSPEVQTPTIPTYRAPVTATDLNLRGLSLDQSDWYDRIPIRSKLRIITNILEGRCPQGGVYEKMWKLFESKSRGQPTTTIVDLLTKEKTQLSLRCRALTSPIPATIRREASQIIADFQQNLDENVLQEKILILMEKEFERKEELFQCIREQAEAEGIVIEDGDQYWAKHHFIENTHRFSEALSRWLDNN